MSNLNATQYADILETTRIPTDISTAPVNNIKDGINTLIDYLSLKPSLNKDDKIRHLEYSILSIQKEIHAIREARGGVRRTNKKTTRRNKTRARK